ncbi:hypothetical protein H0H81_003172, partial [Sphagnurus paluster]
GAPVCIVLDIVEVAKLHTREALADMFVEILKDFRIDHKQLDTKDDKDKNKCDSLSEEEHELSEMEDIAVEEELTLESENSDDANDDLIGEDLNEWVDKAAELTEAEHTELKEAVKPVGFLFKVINLMTILLPEWKKTLEDLDLRICNNPNKAFPSDADDSDMQVVPKPASKTSKLQSKNMFNNLFTLLPSSSAPVMDKLQIYLSTEVENVADPIKWWFKK